MSKNVLPPLLWALFASLAACKERPEGPPKPPWLVDPPPRPSARPLLRPSAAPSAWLAPSVEQPAPAPEPDPPGPAGDLLGEVAAFTDLRTCARSHRMADPVLADAIEALGYDTFATDACRSIEALKEHSVAPCEPILSTALRKRCQAHVAMFDGRPDLCPTDERVPGVAEHEPVCLAVARRDVRPCAVLLGFERAACEGLVARDPARCGVEQRCLRQIQRWKPALPAPVGKPPHAGRIEVSVGAQEGSEEPGETHELAPEAAAGAALAFAGGKVKLLVGDPRTFLVTDEQRGGGFVIELPAWPPPAPLRLEERDARVVLRLRSRGALEMTRGSKVKVSFEQIPDSPNQTLKLRLDATLGPSSAPRRVVWQVDTWLRDAVRLSSAMREDLPSITAALVAFSRGVASAHPMNRAPLRDEAARALLPSPVSWFIPERGGQGARWRQGALRLASVGLIDHMALRTAAIDAALLDALGAGVRQVVLLGAGLDARAYRLDALAPARVFEVDHPATQRYKQRRLGGLAPRSGAVTHVAVDFSRDSLGDALAAAGHDDRSPSFWIWEGVTMYLPREATTATLATLSARSCPGSGLVVSYMTPEGALLPPPLRQIAEALFGVIGEPIIGAFSPQDMASLLHREGFVVQTDEHSVDWARRFDGNRLAPVVFRSERLAVAWKGPLSSVSPATPG